MLTAAVTQTIVKCYDSILYAWKEIPKHMPLNASEFNAQEIYDAYDKVSSSPDLCNCKGFFEELTMTTRPSTNTGPSYAAQAKASARKERSIGSAASSRVSLRLIARLSTYVFNIGETETCISDCRC